MGEIPPSSFKSALEQRSLSSEWILKDQQESHQQHLASFLMANATLRKDNATLGNVTTPRPTNQLCHVALPGLNP